MQNVPKKVKLKLIPLYSPFNLGSFTPLFAIIVIIIDTIIHTMIKIIVPIIKVESIFKKLNIPYVEIDFGEQIKRFGLPLLHTKGLLRISDDES